MHGTFFLGWRGTIMSRNRVILINPRICKQHQARLPLSLLALGAVLEGKFDYSIVDGNVDRDTLGTLRDLMSDGSCDIVGMTVMPGPQVAPAIELATAIRAWHPQIPIVWGGFFPTLYPDSAINAPYVDYVVRGQGEETFLELIERLPDAGPPVAASPAGMSSARQVAVLRDVRGLTWKEHGQIVHNAERSFRPPEAFPALPLQHLENVDVYLHPSFMGTRTGVHQAGVGCRYRCSFCGVVSMFNGYTRQQSQQRLEEAALTLRDHYGANALQFYDHNFFDQKENSVPSLEVLARLQMPWWCYARADTLAEFSSRTWDLLRRSRLKMAYIGAEAASDKVLRSMKKGTLVEHTFETARRCREYGVIPEFSFVLGGPEDPEGEIEKTFKLIKSIKKIHPKCEVILYFYSPTPQRDPGARLADRSGPRIPVLKRYGPDGPELPTTPEEWTQPQWINYVCHRDAPWLSQQMRQRVSDFAKVLACRFPTVQDYATPRWRKAVLRGLASWRYASGRYENAWELDFAQRLIPLRKPQRESI